MIPIDGSSHFNLTLSTNFDFIFPAKWMLSSNNNQHEQLWKRQRNRDGRMNEKKNEWVAKESNQMNFINFNYIVGAAFGIIHGIVLHVWNLFYDCDFLDNEIRRIRLLYRLNCWIDKLPINSPTWINIHVHWNWFRQFCKRSEIYTASYIDFDHWTSLFKVACTHHVVKHKPISVVWCRDRHLFTVSLEW